MPRHPLLPILRVGVILLLGSVLLYRPRRPVERAVPAVWATDVDALPHGALRLGEKATTPLEGQKRPPCAPGVEVEAVGACWVPHLKRPPCPAGLYEGNGLCLLPVRAERPATSIGR